MSKTIQILLQKDVAKLGYIGDLIDVKPGYAKNYLFPNSLALRATPAIINQYKIKKVKLENQKIQDKQNAQFLKATLENMMPFTIRKKVGANQTLFGRVTEPEVKQVLEKALGQTCNYTTIDFPTLNTIGLHEVLIKLHPEVVLTLTIQVTG
uniref:50S ribosomal protein L9, chloroplastic n=1 Tax=Glaucocystis incrassata TaxID=1789788 RepID=A0A3G1IVC5_9EUKA|nr:ribosomal protein L9 [Glaucocystis incrassata]ASQ39993.1 ribosomal protein L9 [Glaucocystis incrassata]